MTYKKGATTLRLTDIDSNDRPREKLRNKGALSLCDEELLAILLGSGSATQDVLSLSKAILKEITPDTPTPKFETLCKITGIGPAKASLILSAIEFGRRRTQESSIKILTPKDIYGIVIPYANKKQEHFIVISLNGAQEVIAIRVISVGLVNQTQVHPREVFADPLTDRASSIVVAHNHPSGSLTPSQEDLEVTEKLIQAGKILGIPLLDHIIFSTKGFYSFTEEQSKNTV
ncbi:MAG: DNA repair protein RadC [Candidatus Margulisbacteria bacterium]|nr:DNA repair protein RadC [Candidatus Margulisiibacteriota bacterium]